MAMARIIAQPLTHQRKSGIALPARALAHHRHRSGKAHRAQIIELDLDSSSSSSSSSEGFDVETINGAIKKLDDVIHSIVVRRATPDWLPFLPGYSFWIPPHGQNHPYGGSGGLVEVIGRLSSASRNGLNHNPGNFSSDMMPEDHAMRHRGWPSSSFFVEGGAPTYPVPMEVEVEVNIHNNSERVPTDGDEEG